MHLPDLTDLDHETRQTCNQFINYHLMACKRELVADKRWDTPRLPASHGRAD